MLSGLGKRLREWQSVMHDIDADMVSTISVNRQVFSI